MSEVSPNPDPNPHLKSTHIKKVEIRLEMCPDRFFIQLSLGVQIFEVLPHMTRSKDLKDALDLCEKNFSGPNEPTRSEIIKLIKMRMFRVFVLKKDDLPKGKAVAGVAVTATWGQTSAVHLEYVAITDACQGKGLGTVLMKSLISRYQFEVTHLDKPPKVLTLECETKLINFYSRLGFKLSSAKPNVWALNDNGKEVSHKYYMMGVQLTDVDSSEFINNANFLTSYRKAVGGVSALLLDNLRKKKICKVSPKSVGK